MPENLSKLKRPSDSLLLISVCMIAACAIVYELVIATLASYLLGNSIHQFSITVGLFMSSMGFGSFLSKYFNHSLITRFIQIEILIGLIGGISTVSLFMAYLAFESVEAYLIVMIIISIMIGGMVGLEIPILMRIIEQKDNLRVTVANVLAFDYGGSLIGSIVFPLILLKYTGIIQTNFIVALLNILVAMVTLINYRSEIERLLLWGAMLALIGIGLFVSAYLSPQIEKWLEDQLYRHTIILSEQSPYQKIVLTKPFTNSSEHQKTKIAEPGSIEPKPPKISVQKRRNDVRLFIDGNLQFSSVDEYRYHEALVHPAMGLAKKQKRVLILGGGDGLALREVLKYPSVEHVTLIDIDPEITELCAKHPEIVSLNQGSLSDKRVKILNQDAYQYVERLAFDRSYDVAIIDLPDPNYASLSKLYSVTFYVLLEKKLTDGGILVSQSTSPFFSRYAFWCIHHTMQKANLHTYAYHVDVPSMGDWGFNLSAKSHLVIEDITLTVPTEFLTPTVAASMFQFGKDISPINTKPNTLTRPILQYYYHDQKWRHY